MNRETKQALLKAADMQGLSAELLEVLANAERYLWLRDAPRADVRIVGRGARKGDALDATVDELRGAA